MPQYELMSFEEAPRMVEEIDHKVWCFGKGIRATCQIQFQIMASQK